MYQMHKLHCDEKRDGAEMSNATISFRQYVVYSAARWGAIAVEDINRFLAGIPRAILGFRGHGLIRATCSKAVW